MTMNPAWYQSSLVSVEVIGEESKYICEAKFLDILIHHHPQYDPIQYPFYTTISSSPLTTTSSTQTLFTPTTSNRHHGFLQHFSNSPYRSYPAPGHFRRNHWPFHLISQGSWGKRHLGTSNELVVLHLPFCKMI